LAKFRTCVLLDVIVSHVQEETDVTTTVDTDAPSTEAGTPDVLLHPIGATVPDAAAAPSESSDPATKAPAKKAGKKAKTLELTLTVIGTADGEWRAELKRGTTYVARDLAIAAAAVSRAAKELHEDLATPIDEVIEAARSEQAARVAALEAELEAARKALADLN
jgi:hypothetical protein